MLGGIVHLWLRFTVSYCSCSFCFHTTYGMTVVLNHIGYCVNRCDDNYALLHTLITPYVCVAWSQACQKCLWHAPTALTVILSLSPYLWSILYLSGLPWLSCWYCSSYSHFWKARISIFLKLIKHFIFVNQTTSSLNYRQHFHRNKKGRFVLSIKTKWDCGRWKVLFSKKRINNKPI